MHKAPLPPGLTLLVLGVGNTLMSDEAAGPRALAAFEARHGTGEGLTCLDAGTLSFTLAADIGAADGLIVFDAARLKEGAGAIRLMEGAVMDAFVRSGALSVHEVGLRDLLDMARLTGDLPPRRALIGIEPVEIGWGLELTPLVAAAIPTAVDLAGEIVARWRREWEEATNGA